MTTAPPTSAQAFPVAREPMALIEEALDRAYLPRASWMDDDEGGAPSFRVTPDGVAILDICGVIDSRASWLWTGYDEVQTLAAQAFAHAGVAAVVLSLDSPGGVAAGMVDTGRALRAMADRSGKPFVAHAGPMACSAAYGLACAADRILVTEDGTVGSVGVIAVVTDRTAQNAQEGLARKVIASGTMKADGHPDQPLSDAALGRMRARVMQLAQMFGGWVAQRRGMTPEAVMALQGGVAYGADAVTRGLADATGTLADAITTAAALAADPDATKKRMPGMAAARASAARSMADGAIADDRGFIDAMIPHHEAALAMVKEADGKLESADLKTLAAGIKAAQTAEIAEMKRIRDALPAKKSTAASMAAARATATKEKTMDTAALKSLETFALLRADLGAASDDEARAAVGTLRQRAAQVDTLAADLTTLRQQLADRDAATLTAARQAVLDKHLQRGALTPAMQKDEQYMGDLAPLSPDALDRVLSKLPSAPAAVTPRTSGIDPKGADVESVELTDEDKAFAKAAGLSEESFLKTKRADARRAR